jgi:hypothetical protein
VRVAVIALLICMALALQTSLARFLSPSATLVDLVFVAVVYIALTDGPAAGLMAGALAGLAQDALASTGTLDIAVGAEMATRRSIIGIGGLANTVIGFIAGIIGNQFIVARPLPRGFVFFTATLAHAIIFVGLYRMLDTRYEQASLPSILSRGGANALVGILVFQIADVLPAFFDRRRSMRGGMRINRRLE